MSNCFTHTSATFFVQSLFLYDWIRLFFSALVPLHQNLICFCWRCRKKREILFFYFSWKLWKWFKVGAAAFLFSLWVTFNEVFGFVLAFCLISHHRRTITEINIVYSFQNFSIIWSFDFGWRKQNTSLVFNGRNLLKRLLGKFSRQFANKE